MQRPLRPEVVRFAGATLLATLAAGPAALHAGNETEEVRGLLDRMVSASRSIDYIGTFVYRNDSTLQSMKIIHRADASGSRERLVALSGAAREVIRDGDRITCILPGDRSVAVARRRPGRRLYSSTVFDPEVSIGSDTAEFYFLTRGGVERVADREATVIHVRPKDRYRYGFRLAVDRETGLLLKSELLGDNATTLEQLVYTHLELPESIPDDALEPRISDAGFTRYEKVPVPGAADGGSTARPQEWMIGWLPAGFRVTDESYGPILPGHGAVDHRVYSDGLASLSIFIEPALDVGDRFEGSSSVGAVNAFSRIIDGYQLSVVGEVPGVTVDKVAASIVRR